MDRRTRWINSVITLVFLGAALPAAAGPAAAASSARYYDRDGRSDYRADRSGHRYTPRDRYRRAYQDPRQPPRITYRGRVRMATPGRVRWYRNGVILRPHGRWDQRHANGPVVVTRKGVSTTGRYCREFRQWVSIGDRVESAYGMACRRPDGSWNMIAVDNR